MINKGRGKRTTARDAESARILKRSSLYREFRKEKEEINKLKWLESEKTGRDIGYEQALLIWARAHRNSWRAARLRNLT